MKKAILAAFLIINIVFGAMAAFAEGGQETGAESAPYADISGHWAEAEIRSYADPGVFADKDGKFSPDKPITRGEFILMLHKALGININYFKATDINEFFSDVSNEDACASKLYDLVITNIIDRRGAFGPGEALPRDEMVHYIMNALRIKAGNNYAVIKMLPAPFADDGDITPAYKNDIIEAALLKIIKGKGGNMLCPLAGSTRAEAAAVIGRLMNTVKTFNSIINVKPSAEMTETFIKMKLSINNPTGKAVSIYHGSGQKYDFVLLDSDRKALYKWSSGKFFIMMVTSTVIDAGNSVEFTETLDGDEFKSIKDRISYMTAYITGHSNSFEVDPKGYEIGISK